MARRHWHRRSATVLERRNREGRICRTRLIHRDVKGAYSGNSWYQNTGRDVKYLGVTHFTRRVIRRHGRQQSPSMVAIDNAARLSRHAALLRH
jgi:hypothetical protein